MEVCLLKSPKEKTVSGNNVTHTLSSCCHGEEPRQRKISVAVANLDHIIVSAGAKTLHHSCEFIPHLNSIITCLQNIISGPAPKLMFVTFGSFQMFDRVVLWRFIRARWETFLLMRTTCSSKVNAEQRMNEAVKRCEG